MKELIPSEGTVKAVAYAVIALAGIYYVSRFNQFHEKGSNLLKPVADGIGNLISTIKYAGEGIEATQAGVILRPKDFVNGAIKPEWYQSQAGGHPKNPEILQMAITAGGLLKEPYKSLLQNSEILLIKPDGTTESI